MDSSLRYFGCAVGFGFGVLWMTEGIGAAIGVGGTVLVALGSGLIAWTALRPPREAAA